MNKENAMDIRLLENLMREWKRECGLCQEDIRLEIRKRDTFCDEYIGHLYTNRPGVFIGAKGELVNKYREKFRTFGIENIVFHELFGSKVVIE